MTQHRPSLVLFTANKGKVNRNYQQNIGLADQNFSSQGVAHSVYLSARTDADSCLGHRGPGAASEG